DRRQCRDRAGRATAIAIKQVAIVTGFTRVDNAVAAEAGDREGACGHGTVVCLVGFGNGVELVGTRDDVIRPRDKVMETQCITDAERGRGRSGATRRSTEHTCVASGYGAAVDAVAYESVISALHGVDREVKSRRRGACCSGVDVGGGFSDVQVGARV